jgi:hypothetical protein
MIGGHRSCPECPVPRLPPATLYLLWIITGGFVLQLLAGPAVLQWFALWPIGSEALGGPGFLPWQLLSYAALHGDFIHLFFNGLMLWMLGAVLERPGAPAATCSSPWPASSPPASPSWCWARSACFRRGPRWASRA